MLKNVRPEIRRFVVGFYSPTEPYVRQDWKPEHRDDFECDLPTANRRLLVLCRCMGARELVDGLILSSVFVADAETGEALLVRLADGVQIVADADESDRLMVERIALLALTAAYHGTPEVARALSAMAEANATAN